MQSANVAEMKAIHSNPQELPAGERHLCRGSFDALMKKSSSGRRRWLRHMRMVKARAHREGSTQTAITEFFQRAKSKNG
jgi:hypothetical protein